MSDVFFTTISKVAVLLFFIGLGYLLRRMKKLPDNTGRILSTLTALIFTPAYNIKALSESFTMANIGSRMLLLVYGLVFLVVVIVLARLLAKPLARNDFERSSYIYAFTIPNFGYFGYPLVESIFGTEVLGELIIFCLPLSIACYTYGYLLFDKNSKLTLKKLLTTPMISSVLVGCALGLSGIKLPGFVTDVVNAAAGCMSTASMLLAGVVLGGFPLLELVKGKRSWLMSAIRLVGLPGIFGLVLWLVGLRGMYLALPVLILSMPLGLNLVVYPESMGIDASDNAKMCFLCNLLTVVVLPITFSLIAKFM